MLSDVPRAQAYGTLGANMNLIVSTRVEEQHLRFEVQGQWQYNDALNLAYQVKAVALRESMDHLLVDLRRVTRSPMVEGKFLVCDRLRRALPPSVRVALLGPVEMLDLEARQDPLAAKVVLFASERSALLWLDGIHAAIKNPSVLRAEGQAAGKET
jgi:hypothetical protein